MVLWLYIGLFLAVPPILVGLALAVLYLYIGYSDRECPELVDRPRLRHRRSWWWRPW